MVELVAQHPFVDAVGKPYAFCSIEQGEGGAYIAVARPYHLQHQQLVEVRIEQTADNGVKLPGVIVDALRNVELCHP